ncbi:Transcriptional regulatory protein sin3 [Phlyctochytrium bullatum]|nr:Transcriptional regulatory protein sin3 [Phlyctochytrium bullatum]
MGPAPPSGMQPPPGAPPPAYADTTRPLNVKDALTYLDQVKIQFQEHPQVYNQFLDIMKDFKAQTIDTPGVIDRVSNLFRGYPNLINGFNTFLPPGYRLEAPANPKDPVRVTTPQNAGGTILGEGHNAYGGPPPTGGGTSSHTVYYTTPGAAPPVYTPLPGSAPAPSLTHSPPYPHMAPPPSGPHHPHPHGPPGQQPPPAAGGPPPMPAPAVSPAGAGPSAPPGPSNMGPVPQQSIAPSSGLPPQQGPPPPGFIGGPAPTPPQVLSGQPPSSGGPGNPIGGPPAQTVAGAPTTPAPPPSAATPGGAASSQNKKAPVEFNHAINYVNKIKNRFAAEPETYKQFLEILQTYQKEQRPIQENAPDLLDEFKQFLPDNSAQGAQSRPPQNGAGRMPTMGNFSQGGGDRRTSGATIPPQAAAGQSKKGTKRSAPSTSTVPVPAAQPVGSSSQPSKKRAKPSSSSAAAVAGGLIGEKSGPAGSLSMTAAAAALPKPDTIEELEWIDRCKRTIGNKASYTEFLKVLNLFSQEIIDAKTLVERVEPFLAKAPELFEWFKKFVKYDEDVVIVNTPAERPQYDLRTSRRIGHSYRQLPPEAPRHVCSGRDEIAKEVLNDDWISQPEYMSETGFVAHKKTQYEEAMHKCEEERYEFDINIEANLHTIALLEPIYRKIQTMTQEEKAKFKLPPGLGGQSTTIYQRVIKKIYDKDKGQEVIDALHNSPATAVPVVLKRLKQKDEEWKRAQRDWNKVWREIDAKNYYKALDHKGITFKASDKKSMSTKALVAEIENIYREQKERRSLLVGPGSGIPSKAREHVSMTRYQIELRFKDPDIFRDVRRLIMSQVTNTTTISQSDEDRILEFLTTFVRRFFFAEGVDDLRDSEEQETDGDGVGTDNDGDEIPNGNSNHEDSSNEAHTNGLRKDLLVRRAEAGGLVGAKKESNDDNDGTSPSLSGVESAPPAIVKKDSYTKSQKTASRKRRPTYVFYTNTSFYCFFRLYQILYSRLLKMKQISQHLAENPPRAETLNPVAMELGIQSKERAPDAIIPNVKDRYSGLKQAISDLFDGKMEAQEYEDRCRALFGTSGYLMFTVDKLCQAVVKQIQAIQADPKGHDLVELYFKDREKPNSSSRQEAVYRLSAEGLVDDESLYRLEYYVKEKSLTIQLLSKDDVVADDSISSEEKWSLYVDHFIQLSATEGVRLRHRPGPFLRRNLPNRVSDDPPTDVETRSGLELKICLNTYKIFFVENTEDYFRRKKDASSYPSEEARQAIAEASSARFRSWLEFRTKEIEEERKMPVELFSKSGLDSSSSKEADGMADSTSESELKPSEEAGLTEKVSESSASAQPGDVGTRESEKLEDKMDVDDEDERVDKKAGEPVASAPTNEDDSKEEGEVTDSPPVDHSKAGEAKLEEESKETAAEMAIVGN